VSKRKNQRKTAIYLLIVGAGTPNDVQPHGSSQQKQQKKKTGFPPSNLGRSWFSFASFLFTEKKRRAGLLLLLFF